MSVIIVGGGMTGATLALALSSLCDQQISIDLIEAFEPESHDKQGFDARSIALAYGSCQELEKIGVWSSLAPYATAIRQIEVSDQGHLGGVTIHAHSYRVDALGYVVELRHIGQQLFDLLKNHHNIRLHYPAKVTDVKRETDGVMISMDNGQQLSAKLVVAADGSYSSLAAALKINYQHDDYQQMATIGYVTTAQPHDGRAFERFTRYGPLALLPMSSSANMAENRSALVWCHPEARQWDDQTFILQLQKEFGWRLGKIHGVGPRDYYPLALRRAEHSISHRFALAGNAAQTLHPIAGQGFNLGLRDVITLAETLAFAKQQHEDLGSYSVLNRYAQKRQKDRDTTVNMTDGLLRLFANNCFSLEVGRNLGLMLMDSCELLRDSLVSRTLGHLKR